MKTYILTVKLTFDEQVDEIEDFFYTDGELSHEIIGSSSIVSYGELLEKSKN